MKRIGTIVLSFEEVGELSALYAWKSLESRDIYGETSLFKDIPLTALVHLSTCNRVEFIYCATTGSDHDKICDRIMHRLPPLHATIKPRFLRGQEAMLHLLRLATGLESMVLGETEIRAQMKRAFEGAEDANMLDVRLRTLFQYIFQEARNIRASIPMDNLPLSMPALSIKKLREKWHAVNSVSDSVDSNSIPAVVVIGSGPMSHQAMEYLSKWAPRLVWVNRTISKIESAANKFRAEALSFDKFVKEPQVAGRVGAIVSATSRKDAFLTPELITSIKGNRVTKHNLLLVDLALPPDVDPGCGNLEGVEIYNLDNLQKELENNKQNRKNAAVFAESMLKESLIRIEARIIAALSGKIVKTIQAEVQDASRKHLDLLLSEKLSHLTKKEKRMLYSWAIQSNKDLNRIHQRGIESVLHYYYSENSDSISFG